MYPNVKNFFIFLILSVYNLDILNRLLTLFEFADIV